MNLKDLFTEGILWLIFTLFKIYTTIATIILTICFPVTKYLVQRKLKSFGIEINGPRHTDIKVLNEKRFYIRLAIEGSFGLLDSLMDKDWYTQDLKGIIGKFLGTRRQREVIHPLTWVLKVFNLQTKARVWEVGQNHYDIGNEIIESMLDRNLQYTCGYWKDANNLDEAQLAKMVLIAKKLKLKPGMRVLDIGCGYGTLAYHLATEYGVSVVGCSVSKEQIKFARDLCKGLPCEFSLCDYRDLNQKFDRIVSVGMFEHVGGNNHKMFFEVCYRCLEDEGILLLHTIGNAHKKLESIDTWVHKYIFPNGYVPYYMEVCKALENQWVIEDWQNFGLDYSKTLAAWEKNFDEIWPKFEKKYGERFHIMWKTYLQSAQACFLTRSLQLWQIVLSKDGLREGYYATR